MGNTVGQLPQVAGGAPTLQFVVSTDGTQLQRMTLQQIADYLGSGSGAPVNTTPPSITGTPQVGQVATYVPGVWQGSPTIEAVWLLDGVEFGSALIPFAFTILHAFGILTVRETATIGQQSAQATSANFGPVTQVTGTTYFARETLEAGIPSMGSLSGTPEPIGTTNYLNVWNLSRLSGGGLVLASSADFDYGNFYFDGGSERKYRFDFADVQHAYQLMCGFGITGTYLSDAGGTSSGYMLKMLRTGYGPTAQFDVTLQKLDGSGGNISLGTATIANGVTTIGVVVDLTSPTAISITISRDNGADITINVPSESAPQYRANNIHQYAMRKASGSPRMTWWAGETSVAGFAQADRYALIFQEEFSNADTSRFVPSGTLTAEQWRTRPSYWPGVINGEYQRYTDPSDPGNTGSALGRNPFSIVNGKLRIEARRLTTGEAAQYSDWGGYQSASAEKWISGELRKLGGFNAQYGYVAIRAKFPSGKGFWPALWFLNEGDIWPPEIDIVEADGTQLGKAHHALHLRNDTTGAEVATASGWLDMPAGRQITDFHNYEVEWTPTTVTWYIDGVQMYSAPHNAHFRMYLLLSLAVGSGFGAGWIPAPDATTPASAFMEIDWVRWYQRPSQLTGIPIVVTKPSISIAGSGVGAIVTITHGTYTGATSQNGYLRIGTVKVAGTDNATSYTLTAAETGGKTLNYVEEPTSASGGKTHVNSNWIWSP